LRSRLGLATALAVAFAVTCSDSSGPTFGGTGDMGNGQVRTFFERDDNGHPKALGALMTAGALVGLPATDSFVSVPLPVEASGTVFTHMYYDYVPHGHEPIGVYDTAHYDFHFYFVPSSQRASITGGVDSVAVPGTLIPADYKKVSQVITAMGVHWADSTAPEFTGGGFQRTFIYGYHEGAFQFYDIMITRDFFLSHASHTGTIKQPASFPASGYYPTTWRVSYDNARQEFRVALEGFVAR